MPKEPVISGHFKGMAVIQVFKNNTINNCTSISKWVAIDQELMNSMIFSSREIKYIETENSGNVIKLYDENKSNIKSTYYFNTRHGLYLNNKHTGSVECLNLIDYIEESDESDDSKDSDQAVDNEEDYGIFIERFSEKSERRSFGRSSFSSERVSFDETIDGIFIFNDILT